MLYKCSICQSEIELSDGMKYCPKCGKKITPPIEAQPLIKIFQCPNCSADLVPNAKFCSKCGNRILYNQDHLSVKGKRICWILVFIGVFIIWGITVLHGMDGLSFSVIPLVLTFAICQIYYTFSKKYVKLSEINKHCGLAFAAAIIILIIGYYVKTQK